MDLINMKSGEGGMPPAPYPCGLRLTLNQEQLQALGFKDLPSAGTQLRIEALATVTRSATEDPDADGDVDLINVELQLTELGCEVEAGPEPAEKPGEHRMKQAAKLYKASVNEKTNSRRQRIEQAQADTDGGGTTGPFGALNGPVGR
jgi:hypothetical protein